MKWYSFLELVPLTSLQIPARPTNRGIDEREPSQDAGQRLEVVTVGGWCRNHEHDFHALAARRVDPIYAYD